MKLSSEVKELRLQLDQERKRGERVGLACNSSRLTLWSGGSGGVGESQGSQLGAQVGSDVIRGAREDEATRE